MSVEVAQPIFDAIDNAAKTQMNNISKVMSVMGGVIGIFWMIYIGIKALYWYFEGLTVVVQDVLMTIFKASCIMFMAFSVSWYISVIIPTVTDFPVWLGNTISGNSDNNINLVDELLNSYIDGIIKILNSMNFSISAIKAIVAFIFYILYFRWSPISGCSSRYFNYIKSGDDIDYGRRTYFYCDGLISPN